MKSKHYAILITLFLIVISGIINISINLKKPEISNTAVLKEDCPIYINSSLTKPAETLLKGDLIYVFYEHNDEISYVRLVDGNQPLIEGYIPSKMLSYKFDRANQAVMLSDNLYSAPNDNSLLENTYAKELICNIVEYSDSSEWVAIIRPGDTEKLWTKKTNISYDYEFDGDAKHLTDSFYKQTRNYLQKKYAETYKPYYDATVVKKLNNYRESYVDETNMLDVTFTMNATHRNHYKDPDSVKYIQEAKELAESKGDEYSKKLYDTYYREYNQIKEANYILRLTARISKNEIDEESVKLYTDVSPKGVPQWEELKDGFNDFITE